MKRENPRRWVPQDLLPGAQSVVTFGVNFASSAPRPESRPGYGRVARYAWGKDYHLVLEPQLKLWVATFSEKLGQAVSAKILVDSGPLLERAFAHQSARVLWEKIPCSSTAAWARICFCPKLLLTRGGTRPAASCARKDNAVLKNVWTSAHERARVSPLARRAQVYFLLDHREPDLSRRKSGPVSATGSSAATFVRKSARTTDCHASQSGRVLTQSVQARIFPFWKY